MAIADLRRLRSSSLHSLHQYLYILVVIPQRISDESISSYRRNPHCLYISLGTFPTGPSLCSHLVLEIHSAQL